MIKAKGIFLLFFLLAGCNFMHDHPSISLEGYETEKMQRYILEEPLNEISGIAYDARFNQFLTINDEEGILYCLDASSFQIVDTLLFGTAGDYEEIQIDGSTIYILRSDGRILRMKYDGSTLSDIVRFDYKGEKAEYESFYIKKATNELVLIPKKARVGVKAFIINAYTGLRKDSLSLQLDWKDPENKHTELNPSAVGVHPVTGYLYLLASLQHRLLVLDSSWNILSEHHLDKKQFGQPEGITFDKDGNLYITNEAGKKEPTLFFIPKATP